MEPRYEDALRTIARCYEDEVAAHGGKSLSYVASLVVHRGSFFDRLQADVSFTVRNLERLAAWFRDSQNWPARRVPEVALVAMASIGRPVLPNATLTLAARSTIVSCDQPPLSQPGGC
jgi:hypothetical protein